MSGILYTKIEKEYQKKKDKVENEAESRKKHIYDTIPSLKTIDDQISKKSIELSKQIILSSKDKKGEIIMQLNKQIQELKEQKNEYIVNAGYDIEALIPIYECDLCKDTGYITNNNGYNKVCTCFEQKLLNEAYKQENLNIENENFDMFDIGFYSNKSNKNKYGGEMSPRDNILYIKNVAEEFIQNFDNVNQKNIAFVGPVGTGKTFLINCICKELLKQRKTILYQTAPILMDMIMEYKFKQNSEISASEKYNKIFETDLLIIDDLGTETLNENRTTELFNILNTRLLKNKKIIISTNLALDGLYKTYEERIASRIIGNFTICRFIGEDIRLIKKQLGQTT